jgi:lysophospholipase L1-like esterase
MAQQANQKVRALADSDPRLCYIDVATPMLDANGRPRPELFGPDRLHLNLTGYALWAEIIRQALNHP